MKIILYIAVALAAVQAFALEDNSLSGNIYDDATKLPLTGATIHIANLKTGAISLKDGLFVLKNLPAGKFIVQVRLLGYAAQSEEIEISGSIKRDFFLKESAIETGEVVVTGTSTATELRKSPIATSIVTREEIEENGATNIIDALSKTPGISQIQSGQAISKPVIRGLSYNRVVVMQDGVKQEGQQWGDEHGIEIDEFSVDRVEILKGPASLMYGSDGLAGVINILSPNPVAEGTIAGNITAQYQANSIFPAYSGSLAGNHDGLNWRGRFSQKFAGNYRNKIDGRVPNSGFDETDGNGYIGLNRDWGFSHLNFSVFNQNIGIIEGERDSLGNLLGNAQQGFELNLPKQNVRHYKVSLTNSIYFKNSRLDADLGFQQNQRREFEEREGVVNEFMEEEALYMRLNTITYRASYSFPEFAEWQLSVGANGMSQMNANFGEEALIPDYSLFDIGSFAFFKRSFKDLSLSGGLRFDTRSISGEELAGKFGAFSSSFKNISASIGAAYELSEEFLLKLNVARGFRAPNAAELGSNGMHEGTFRYEIGNPLLKPETSLQFDGGISFNNDHVSAEIALFHNGVDNYIFIQKLRNSLGGDSIPDIEEGAPAYGFVQGNARLYGGEISLDIHPHPLDWLHFENSFSLVRGELLNVADSLTNLPQMPAPRFQTELRADFKELGSAFKNVFFKTEVEYNFRQDRFLKAFDTETATPDYALVNIGLGFDVTRERELSTDNEIRPLIVRKETRKLFSVNFVVNNLLDRAYQNHLSRLKYAPENIVTGQRGIFNMGRNFVVRLNVPF
ncbi:MAG: TonB-dependent receptor [Bacteroidota bacterium]